METQTKENQVKYAVAVVAATVFMAAAFGLPTETFFAVFAAGLFLIPASFFIYLIHKVAGT
jgi:hypothetical protein